MNERQLWSIARGTGAPAFPLAELAVGGATIAIDHGEIRYYRVNGREILRRVYVAVRDLAWGTLPVRVSSEQIERRPDGGIRISYHASVSDNDISFRWAGTIELTVAGELIYEITGVTESSFDYARIGLNILHPPSLSGKSYRAAAGDHVSEGRFADGVGPQPYVAGQYLPLLPAFRSLEVAIDGTVTVSADLDGDEFEMEDQRNWLDASFKTYSTPVSPLHAEAGDRIHQRMQVKVNETRDTPPKPAGPAVHQVTLEIGSQQPGAVFPAVGLGMASHGHALCPREADLLSALRLSHLRADALLSGEDANEDLVQAAQAARQCGCGIELAVFADAESPAEFARLGRLAEMFGNDLVRVLVFSEHQPVTSPATIAAARAVIGPGVPLFGGTNLNFAELNRDRPHGLTADGFAFSANPQVHAADDRSMTEAPQSFADMLRTCKSFLGDRPVVVTPVTLLPRFNADAPGAGTVGTGMPPADHRQASLLCAAFTALSVKYLAAGGAAAATFYETTGNLGVIAQSAVGAETLNLGEISVPRGAVFPVYDVISVCSRWSGLTATRVESSDPLVADAASCVVGGRRHVLVANATATDVSVSIEGFSSKTGTVRLLDTASVSASWSAPQHESSFSMPRPVSGRRPTVELGPYAVALVALASE